MGSKIIIVGSGVFGLSSALHLAESGYKDITIYDRLDLFSMRYDKNLGADTASADINKVFRAYYGDKIHYHKLALEARKVFESWDKELPEIEGPEREVFSLFKIFDTCGLIRLDNKSELNEEELKTLKSFTDSGLRDTQFITNNRYDVEKAQKLGWDHKLFPLYREDDLRTQHIHGVLDSTSGLIYASRACMYVQILLRRLGVKFVTGLDHGQLSSLIYDNLNHNVVKGIVTQDGEEHLADLTILATGPWTTSYVSELDGLSEATSGNIVYIKIPESRPDLRKKYSVENFPIINWRIGVTKEKENFSGIGIFPVEQLEGVLKIVIRQQKYTNRIKINRRFVSVPKTINSSPPEFRITKKLLLQVKDFIKVFFPDLVSLNIDSTQLLWYTDTINNDFIIDYVPGKKNLIVCTGGSGHAFKFLPILGRFVVELIEGIESEYSPIFRWRDPKDFEDINGLREDVESDRVYYEQELSEPQDFIFSKEDFNREVKF